MIAKKLCFWSMVMLASFFACPNEAFLEGFANSISLMNQQMTKFVEGIHESVDEWAGKVIDNAGNEECFFICPKGQDFKPRANYTFVPTGCTTFGILIKNEDLPAKNMRDCCEQQQICYHRCNSTKIKCDTAFRSCLHKECVQISKDTKQMTVCETAIKILMMGMLSFGCKTFKDGQSLACVCPKVDEL